jgi:hypothetical protein
VIKLRRVTWVRHLASLEEMLNAYKILVGKPGRYQLGDLGVDVRVI